MLFQMNNIWDIISGKLVMILNYFIVEICQWKSVVADRNNKIMMPNTAYHCIHVSSFIIFFTYTVIISPLQQYH